MTDIVIEVRRGMIAGLFCDTADVRFVVVDWDLLERADSEGIAIEQDHEPLGLMPGDTKTEFNRAFAA